MTAGRSTWASVDGRVRVVRADDARRAGRRRGCARWPPLRDLAAFGRSRRRGVALAAVFGDRLRFRQSPEDKLEHVHGAAGRRAARPDARRRTQRRGRTRRRDVGIAVSDDTACLVPACDAVLRGDRAGRCLPRCSATRGAPARDRPLLRRLGRLQRRSASGWRWPAQLTPLVTAILMPVSSLTIVALSTGLMRVHVPEERGDERDRAPHRRRRRSWPAVSWSRSSGPSDPASSTTPRTPPSESSWTTPGSPNQAMHHTVPT